MDTFIWPATIQTTGQGEFDVDKAKYGDGYTQSVEKGINNNFETWSVSLAGYDVSGRRGVRDPYQFLRNHKGAQKFFWKPPMRSTPGMFTCANYRIAPQGGGYYELTAEFVEEFAP